MQELNLSQYLPHGHRSRNMPVTRQTRYFATMLAMIAFGNVFADDGRMNLLIIETDEHHFSTLGCYGGTIVETPNIDWIARNGALCTSFYATTPVCSPSRASLVSGLYPQKTPVTTNNIPLDDSIVTFAEILRRRGYATGYAGKWHLDGTGKPNGAGDAWLSAISQRYKLVYSSNEEPWLIDLKSDPNELSNLFGQADHKERVHSMTEKLKTYAMAHDDVYIRHPRIRSWTEQTLNAK